MRNPKYIYWSILILLVYFAVASLTGCSTAKELLDKAEKKDPAIVAQYARDKFPCTDLLKPDTLVVFGDTLVWVECPDTATQIVSFVDTLVKPGSTRTVRMPVTLPMQTRYITNWYEDSAKLKLGALELTRSMKEIQDLKDQLKTMTGSRNWYRRYFWWLIVAVVLLGIFSAYKILK